MIKEADYLKELIDANLMDIVACGSHSSRYGEEEHIWDLACLKCAHRYEVLEKVIQRLYYRAEKVKATSEFKKMMSYKFTSL